MFDADGSGRIDFKEFNEAIKYAHRLLLRTLQREKQATARAREAAKKKERAAKAAKLRQLQMRQHHQRVKAKAQHGKEDLRAHVKLNVLKKARKNKFMAAILGGAGDGGGGGGRGGNTISFQEPVATVVGD